MTEKSIRPIDEILYRLRIVMEAENDAQLAKKLDIPQTTISTWKKRGIIPYEACAKVALEKNMSLDVFIFGDVIPNYKELHPINAALFQTCWRVAEVFAERKNMLPEDLVIEYYNQRAARFAKYSSMSLEEYIDIFTAQDNVVISDVLSGREFEIAEDFRREREKRNENEN